MKYFSIVLHRSSICWAKRLLLYFNLAQVAAFRLSMTLDHNLTRSLALDAALSIALSGSIFHDLHGRIFTGRNRDSTVGRLQSKICNPGWIELALLSHSPGGLGPCTACGFCRRSRYRVLDRGTHAPPISRGPTTFVEINGRGVASRPDAKSSLPAHVRSLSPRPQPRDDGDQSRWMHRLAHSPTSVVIRYITIRMAVFGKVDSRLSRPRETSTC